MVACLHAACRASVGAPVNVDTPNISSSKDRGVGRTSQPRGTSQQGRDRALLSSATSGNNPKVIEVAVKHGCVVAG